MKKYNQIIVAILTVVVSACKSNAQSASPKEAWIQKNITKLELMDLPGDLEPYEPTKDPNGKDLVYILREGLIEFENDDWVYIVSHSFHDEVYDGNPKVGDIALAIDSKKNIYSNTNHVCGGVWMYSKSPTGFSDINHFSLMNNWQRIKQSLTSSLTLLGQRPILKAESDSQAGHE